MVTTVTDNSPQSINTSLFSLDKEVQEVKKTTDALNDKLAGINTESNVISVNGKQGIVELDASDVKALPDTTTIPTTTSELENTSGFITINDVGASFVPVTRKVNNKALSSDITLTASDVGALPNTTTIPTKTSQLTNDSGFITSSSSITGNAATATTADKVKNALTVNGKTYDGSSAVDAGVQKIENGGTGATTALGAFESLANVLPEGAGPLDTEHIIFQNENRKNWGLYTLYHFWEYIKSKISSVLGLTKDNYGGKAATAGTADRARNMYYQNLDLSALDKTKFYPLVCYSGKDFAEVAICSESGVAFMDYNQNRIHFDISTQGWSDLPPTLNIREYTCYDNNEITIGCIGRGVHNGAWAIWLRGGLHYTCFSRNSDLTLHTSNYTYGDEVYTVGTNYYGGSNTNVGIMFTPQSTITEGAYSSKQITATEIKANNRMAIPIGAPSQLKDGCIWIER